MLSCFIAEFLDYCKNLSLAESSIKDLIRYVRQLDEYLIHQSTNGPLQVSNLNYKHLFNYTVSNNAMPTTIKMRIWAIKKFFNFLHLHEYIKDNISKELIPPKIPKKETSFLTQFELKIIFGYLAKRIIQPNGLRDFIIISLMATLGFRKSTVVAINGEHIDIINQRIFIEEKGIKGKRPVLLPMSLLMLIEEYISKMNLTKGPLFLIRNKKRFRTDAVDKIVGKIKISLLNEGHQFASILHPHIFRHSAGTEINDIAGFDITREMLGHRNEQNTRKYIHLSPTSYGAYMKRHPYFSNEIFGMSKAGGSLL